MRKPPKLYRPQQGDEMTIAFPLMLDSMDALADWMHEAVEKIEAAQTGRYTSRDEDGTFVKVGFRDVRCYTQASEADLAPPRPYVGPDVPTFPAGARYMPDGTVEI